MVFLRFVLRTGAFQAKANRAAFRGESGVAEAPFFRARGSGFRHALHRVRYENLTVRKRGELHCVFGMPKYTHRVAEAVRWICLVDSQHSAFDSAFAFI